MYKANSSTFAHGDGCIALPRNADDHTQSNDNFVVQEIKFSN
jgi:hypothetical protein